MSTKSQTTKNIDLIYKLMEYLLKARDVPKLPKDVSFVPFSKGDKRLNRANEELLKNLTKEGKPVVKAEELTDSKQGWKITPINFSM